MQMQTGQTDIQTEVTLNCDYLPPFLFGNYVSITLNFTYTLTFLGMARDKAVGLINQEPLEHMYILYSSVGYKLVMPLEPSKFQFVIEHFY